jgi:hypothetical protein
MIRSPFSHACMTVGLLFLLAPAPASLGAQPGKSTLVIHVDDDANPDGNGTGARPYHNLPDAVAAAREEYPAYRKVIIVVAPGQYPIDNPLRIDFPVDIHGSNVPELDSDQWPTGTVQWNTETLVIAQSCAVVGVVRMPLVTVGKADGSVTRSVSIRNLSLKSNSTGCSVLQFQHVQDAFIANNIVRGPAFTGIDFLASSGTITGNFVSGIQGCGICIGAGNDASPARIEVTENRSVGNSGGGLLLSGTTFPIIEVGDVLEARVLHNDLSSNVGGALGFGLRVLALGTIVPDSQAGGSVLARIYGNRLAGNRNGMMIDAGFPRRNLQPDGCDTRVFTGRLELNLRSNSISGSLSNTAIVSFTRAQVFTAPVTNPPENWQYLHNATFSIDDPDLSLAQFVVDHPLLDPYTGGNCDDDITNEALNNRFLYNGMEMPAMF